MLSIQTSVRLGVFATIAMSCAAANGATPAATETYSPYLLRVEMKANAEVSQAQVTLGDVAYVTSTNLELLRRAVAVPLGHAPRSGEPVFLESERVQQWLRSRLALQTTQLSWTSTPGTLVSTAQRETHGQAVVDLAQQALRKHLTSGWMTSSGTTLRIEMEAMSIPGDFLVPAGTVAFSVRPLRNIPAAPHMVVWVDVHADNRFVRAVPVRFDVGLFTQAPVAASRMPAGMEVESSTFVQREVDIARMQDSNRIRTSDDIPKFASSPAMRLSRNVKGGDVITAGHVQPVPAVSRGEWANLTSQHGMVTLESRVEILQDGRLGQVVPVRQANANGSVMARVTARGHVEIQQ